MTKSRKFTPEEQIGDTCKITAIATVDKYFAESLNLQPIPLRKASESYHASSISIRNIAKQHSSLQGEILEFLQWKEILDFLGYESQIISFEEENEVRENLKDQIQEALENDNVVIGCFAVSKDTSLPTAYNGLNEHAAIISHYNRNNDIIKIIHWGKEYSTTLTDFCESSLDLPKTRNPEFYFRTKKYFDKYDLTKVQNDSVLSDPTLSKKNVRKTISPRPDTGFRGKLLIIKKPIYSEFLKNRTILYLNQLLVKITNFINTPSLERNIALGFIIGLIAVSSIIIIVATLGAAFPSLGLSLSALALVGGSLSKSVMIGCAIPLGISFFSGSLGKLSNKPELESSRNNKTLTPSSPAQL